MYLCFIAATAVAFLTSGANGLVAKSRNRVQVTPVEKVVQMLETMLEELTAERDTEAADYEKFSCYCNTRTKELTTKINDGNTKIQELSAGMAEKLTENSTETTSLMKNNKLQKEKEAELEAKYQECTDGEAKYDEEHAELTNMLESIDNALKSLNDQHDTTADVYEFHSDAVVKMITEIRKETDTKRDTLITENEKREKSCENLTKELTEMISNTKHAVKTNKENIVAATETYETLKGEMITQQSEMKDNTLYLKENTQVCERRATEHDQRFKMRADEIEALEQAVKIIKDSVVDNFGDSHNFRNNAKKTEDTSLDFVQLSSSSNAGSQTSVEERVAEASRILLAAAKKTKNPALIALSSSASFEPFAKLEKLIQALIERLQNEARQEATKKGVCNEKLNTITEKRREAWLQVQKLNAKMSKLEVQNDAQRATLKRATKDHVQAAKELQEATDQRAEEHAENTKALKAAKAGEKAVTEALDILRSFYHQASYALIQQPAQDPLAQDVEGGHQGHYKGGQDRSKAIISMIKVIQTDFKKSIATTTQAEKDSITDFAKLDKSLNGELSTQWTTMQNSVRDNMKNVEDYKNAKKNLHAEMTIVDFQNKAFEAYRKQCVDSGMTAEERVKAREDEIQALEDAKTALTV